MKYLNQVEQVLKSRGVGLIGCDDEEISKLEQFFEIKLPAAYIEFLSLMGKYSGPLNVGTDCFYEDLFELRELAEELLVENSIEYALSPYSFVFEMHQGYQFLFFESNQGDNPAVFSFSEGSDLGVHLVFDTYSEYWLKIVGRLDKTLSL